MKKGIIIALASIGALVAGIVVTRIIIDKVNPEECNGLPDEANKPAEYINVPVE